MSFYRRGSLTDDEGWTVVVVEDRENAFPRLTPNIHCRMVKMSDQRVYAGSDILSKESVTIFMQDTMSILVSWTLRSSQVKLWG